MDVKVVEQENWSRMVEVLVPQDELQPEFEKGYRKYQKKVKIQGFRPGRAPLAIIKQMYGPRIEIEVIEDIIPRIITDAWKQENLKIVSPPKVDDLDYQPGSDLRITFTVDVEPEIQIEKIEGFRFDRKVYEVEDEDVEQALQTLREEHAVWENIDEPATEENFVLLDLQELDESGLPIVGRKFENELFALKNQQGEVTELGRQVIGARAGETRVVVLTPSPRPGSDEPVQPVKFEATIKEVRRKNLPELDDEFAKDLGDYDSLEELKKALREQIQRRVQQDLDRELERQIIDEIIKNNPFEVPKSMVDTYLDNFVQQIKQSAQDQN
ncbi:MAG: trigger factor, partial [Calditrichaeota bacterium]